MVGGIVFYTSDLPVCTHELIPQKMKFISYNFKFAICK